MYPPVKWFYVLVAYLITPLFALPNSYGAPPPRHPRPPPPPRHPLAARAAARGPHYRARHTALNILTPAPHCILTYSLYITSHTVGCGLTDWDMSSMYAKLALFIFAAWAGAEVRAHTHTLSRTRTRTRARLGPGGVLLTHHARPRGNGAQP